MGDSPPPALLIAEVRRALGDGLPAGFAQKVAANALGIAQRELENGSPATPEETAGLSATIRDGGADHALVGALIRLTIAKMEIDQPGYPGFAAWKAGR